MYKIIGSGFNVVEKQPNNTHTYVNERTEPNQTYTNTFTPQCATLLILTVDVHSIVIFACLFKCVYGKCFTNVFFIHIYYFLHCVCVYICGWMDGWIWL